MTGDRAPWAATGATPRRAGRAGHTGHAGRAGRAGRAAHACIAAFVVVVGCASKPPPELRDLGALPAWRFSTEQGAPIGDQSLAGKPWVANFLFTSCPTSCPPLARATADLQRRVAAWRPTGGPRIVSFTVDPVTDSAEVLRTFARRYGADAKIWSFARADYAATEALVTRGFLQPLTRSDRRPGAPLEAIADKPTPFDTAHTLRFVLVDGRGTMRALYDTDPESLARLDNALRWLYEHPP
jgi:protein SCO1/2